MRDQWMNYTDTSFVTVTPFYEEQITDLAMYTMQGDGKPEWQDYGFRPEYLFDASRNDGGFHTTNSSGKLPHQITFKCGKAYQLRRFKIFQRSEDNYPYNQANPKEYELWGTNETRIPTAVMMAGPVWELSNRLTLRPSSWPALFRRP